MEIKKELKLIEEEKAANEKHIEEWKQAKLKTWTDRLPEDVHNRLCNCCSRKSDLEILVSAKWAAWIEEGRKEQGFTKEDALVYILDLLDCNGQFFDLSRGEYDALKHERG